MLFAGLFCGVLFGLSLLLIAWRVEQVLSTLAQNRTDRVIRQLADEGESAMRLGLAASDLQFFQERLQRLRRQDPAVLLSFVTTREGATVALSGDPALRRLVDSRWTARLFGPIDTDQSHTASASAIELRTLPGNILTGTNMLDAAGTPAAAIWIVSDPDYLRTQARGAAQDIVIRAAPLALLTFGILFLIMYDWACRTLAMLNQPETPQREGRQPPRQATLLLLAALLLAPAATIWIAREAARPFVTTQIEANASVVAATLAGQIDHALQLGVPLRSLTGLDALFKERLSAAPELSWLELRAPDGAKLAHVGAAADVGEPLSEQVATAGGSGVRVVAAYSLNYVDKALGEILLDLVLALVISAVLVRELTRGLWRRSLLHPLLDYRLARAWRWLAQLRRRRLDEQAETEAMQRCIAAVSAPAGDAVGDFSRQMTRLRLAVFLIALSDELLRPFFTAFASEMQTSAGWLSPAMMAGLPVAAFMTTLALTQLVGPMLAQRFDLRHLLLLVVPAGAIALACTALARDVDVLVILRAVSGAAYGFGLILVQTAIVRHAPATQRARSLAEVAAAIVAAGIVGPPFGGMLAGRVGDAYAMLACALCMVGAAVAILRLRLPRSSNSDGRTVPTASPGWSGYAAVLLNPRAMCVILGSAVPARLVAVTVLVVVVPLYMRQIAQPADTAGRVMLLYFLCFAATASMMAHWSDTLGQRKPFIVAGCLLAAAACLQLPIIGGIAGMAACCALLGIGQAVQSSPQLTLVTEVFEDDVLAGSRGATPEQALAAFRLIERIGSITAPFVTALSITLLGLSGAVAAVGILLLLGGIGIGLGLRGPAPAVRLPRAS
ncbi:MFS transporter [Herbaspirillum sp. RV1423]|uniref:MFS transporter n=1 Tax=Herbaspirillum sp. RV1423 TaxID=1443993 RepID=UPI00054F9E0E|nr:MFS transporter [Herbaspirillum sp. RV1423]